MTVIHDNQQISEECVVALGNFDGLHKGHIKVIETAVDKAKMLNIKSCVFTFENSTYKKSKRLITNHQKTQIIMAMNVDYLVYWNFTKQFMQLSAQQFVSDILFKKLNARAVVCGYNYRFSKGAAADTAVLKKLCEKHQIEVVVVPEYTLENTCVSSTNIRAFIENGNIAMANKLLGRKFSLSGTVSQGYKNGTRMNMKTANIYPQAGQIVPKNGVYITKTVVDNKEYVSVTNVGVCPTLKKDGRVSVETHILDFDSDIYNDLIEIFFYLRIRDELCYENESLLKSAVDKDINTAREYFQNK